ncbi:MAG: hypothetical protein ABI895_27185 [Deltaproteobacteria bacterium]
MALPETALPAAPPVEANLDEQGAGASGMRLKVATRPAAVGTTWLELFHPGSPSELTLEARVRVIADVAGALIQIHDNPGIARQHRRHGRLTPRHVLVTVDGSGCLFNVKEPFSRLLPQQPDLGYLAPELLTQSTASNQQCDIFSLGVLLWEALDNGRLFPHRRAAAISRLSSRSLPAPRVNEEWALPLSEVALRALAHDPAERYADANAFWLALREHLPAPDGARAALSRLVQQALKLELTSEIREAPPYLAHKTPLGASRPPNGADDFVLEPDAARYSLRPEPSSRRQGGAQPSYIPKASDPAWLLSDPPPASSRPTSGLVEKPRPSRMPSVEPPVSALHVNLQRDLADNSLPFFVPSQPAARPFPWGALSFAALIFFGVGAAVAFGAVSALRASRADVIVHERAVLEAPGPSLADAPGRSAPSSVTPPAVTPAAPSPALAAPAPVTAPETGTVSASANRPSANPSKVAETRTEPVRKPVRRAVSRPKPRPMPIRSSSIEERPKDELPKDAPKPEVEVLPFTSQPY